jgi:methylmalonyl-CoA mutase C-terminal domain/subunit
MDKERKIRVMLCKAGLDGHDRGIMVLAALLKDQGFEVIYLGRFQTAEKIVSAAAQEDVDVIGLSTHCGEYRTYVPRIKKLMNDRALDHVLFLVGGVIPVDQIDEIKEKGANEVFPSGVSVKSITDYIRTALENRGC